jgi:hypothetical protein
MKYGHGHALAVTACFAAAAPTFADDSFRCGSKLIVTGMTQAEVLQLCGPPESSSEESLPVRAEPVVGERPIAGRTILWRHPAVRIRSGRSQDHECRLRRHCCLDLWKSACVDRLTGAFLAGPQAGGLEPRLRHSRRRAVASGVGSMSTPLVRSEPEVKVPADVQRG